MDPSSRLPTSVLIVDDYPLFTQALVDWFALNAPGTTCRIADSLAGALAALEAQHYDLLITDIRLPGSETLNDLRPLLERRGAQPTIVVSGYFPVDADPPMRSLGGAGQRTFLSKKDITSTSLRQALTDVMGGRHAAG